MYPYGACRILVCITTNMYSTSTIFWMLLRRWKYMDVMISVNNQ